MAAVEAPQTRTILEESLVSPQAGEEQTLPLTFFDMPWIHFPAMQCLMFFKFPCSKSHFLQTIVPTLKESLSKTLKHYLPLSGNLYYPYPTTHDAVSNDIPEIRYKPGDSVSVTVAEYSGEDDFDYFSGNSPRACNKFYGLLPDFRDPKTEGNNTLLPLTAVQITLFPGAGISIGIINNHVVCDFSSISGFIQAWGKVAIFKDEDDDVIVKNDLLPFYDRSVVKDPNGIALSICNAMKQRKYQPPNSKLPTSKVRATYTLTKDDIERLKALARSEKPDIAHLSSFTVTMAYVWTCLAKSASAAEGQVLDDGDKEHLIMPLDVRARVDPPVPASYFGNFIRPAFSQTAHGQLKGGSGFAHAAEVIGNLIADVVGKRYDLFKSGDKLNERFRAMAGKRKLSIAGSPKFDLYGVDFGWGRVRKFESVSIDRESSAMSLSRSGECDGGLEIGLALSKEEMDAFGSCFYGGLKDLKLS